MAIALQSASAWKHGSGVSTLAWSHTVASGSNLYLAVGVAMTDFPRPTISSITFGSDNLAQIQTADDTGSFGRVAIWGIKNPTVQTATITVTLSTTTKIGAGSSSWTGVDQTTPVEASANANDGGSGGSSNITVTTLTNGAVLIDVGDGNNNNAPSPTTPQTALQIFDQFVTGTFVSSYQTVATAGSTNNSYTSWAQNSTGWAAVGIALKPSGGGGFTAKFRKTLSPVGTRVGTRQVQQS